MNMLPRTDSTVWHEASHAASLCLSGLVPVLVRCDWPTQTQLGSVRFDWTAFEPSELVMREILVSLLQGPLAEGEVLDHWDWPIDPDAVTPECRKDAEQAAFIVGLLHLDRVDFLQIAFKATQLGRDRTFRRLLVAISNALEDKELLFKDELQQLTDAAIAEREET